MSRGTEWYRETLLSDTRWRERQKEVFKREGYRCQNCGCRPIMLFVHHRYYLHGHKPWEYDDECLMSVCNACHRALHGNHRKDQGMVTSMEACELFMKSHLRKRAEFQGKVGH